MPITPLCTEVPITSISGGGKPWPVRRGPIRFEPRSPTNSASCPSFFVVRCSAGTVCSPARLFSACSTAGACSSKCPTACGRNTRAREWARSIPTVTPRLGVTAKCRMRSASTRTSSSPGLAKRLRSSEGGADRPKSVYCAGRHKMRRIRSQSTRCYSPAESVLSIKLPSFRRRLSR